MSELVPGGNLPLPVGTLTLRVPGPFDVSALITDESGKVRGDGDFVFYNQPSAPGVRLRGEALTVDPAALRAGASRVTVVVSPADPDTPLGRLPAPSLQVTGPGGRVVTRFTPPRPQRETVLLLTEIYRRGPAWKLRALGQGYADGLAGVARDFGVDVVEDATPAASPASGGGGGGGALAGGGGGALAGGGGGADAGAPPRPGAAPEPGRFRIPRIGGGQGGGLRIPRIGSGRGGGIRLPGSGSGQGGGLRLPGSGNGQGGGFRVPGASAPANSGGPPMMVPAPTPRVYRVPPQGRTATRRAGVPPTPTAFCRW
ncbi:hypothetical protein GCM10023083_75930 [Streptomyces phyllanthi]